LQEFFLLFKTEFEHTSPSTREMRLFLSLLFICSPYFAQPVLRSSTQCCQPNISSITIDHEVRGDAEDLPMAVVRDE